MSTQVNTTWVIGFVQVEIACAQYNFYMNNIIFKEKSYDQYTCSLHAQLTCEDDEKEISLFNIQVKAF